MQDNFATHIAVTFFQTSKRRTLYTTNFVQWWGHLRSVRACSPTWCCNLEKQQPAVSYRSTRGSSKFDGSSALPK